MGNLRGALGAAGDARTVAGYGFELGPLTPGVPLPPTPNLERTSERELGADAELFGGRLTAGVTRYRKVTRNAIVLTQLSPSAGGGVLPRNGARVRNRGTELVGGARILNRRGLGLELQGAWATLDNTMLRLDVAPSTIGGGIQLLAQGQPLGMFLSHPYSYRDLDGAGVLTQAEVPFDFLCPPQPRGTPEPRREGSLRADLRLGVRMPRALSGLIGARDTELTVVAHNAAIWTDFAGLDPEVNSAPTQSLERNQQFAQPLPRTVTLRLPLAW